MTTEAELVANFTPFARLSPADLALIARTGRLVHFTTGQRLFSEGDTASGCWLLHDGRVALNTDVPGRGQVMIQSLGRGDVLGWSWLVPPHQWHLGAVALTDVTATELDTARLLELAGEDPRFGYALAVSLFDVVLKRLHATRARLLDLYGSTGAGH